MEEAASYRDGFRNLLRIVKLQGFLILGLTVLLMYCIHGIRAQDRYFAMTSEGGKMQLVGLDDPNIGNAALLNWAGQAAVDILTFGFNDVDERFALSRTYFTDDGWESFREAMGKSGLLRSVSNNQQIITSIPKEPPRLTASGLRNGKYSWIVDVPVVMAIRAGNKKLTRIQNVKMIIVKLPTEKNPRGMGINTWYSL